mmetsp:Transcript_20592/g.58371  ORF Transcript_20592/g.58371 Transcript_20592/m.58371 type:complete len:85 (+) Transcript_20592:139-393(+)
MGAAASNTWDNLMQRVTPTPGATNSSDNQDLLNRINTGTYHVVADAPAAAAQGGGGEAAAPAQPAPDAEQLRSQRLAHFDAQRS